MPVELTAMKNTPSKRASLLIAAWYCCSSSSPGGFIMFVLTHSTMPVLEVTLQQGEQVVSTHGELSWMTPTIQLTQHMGTGGAGGGLMQGLKRVLGGGGLFLTHYEAVSGDGMVTFAAKLPGHIVPVDIAPDQAFYVHHHG